MGRKESNQTTNKPTALRRRVHYVQIMKPVQNRKIFCFISHDCMPLRG